MYLGQLKLIKTDGRETRTLKKDSKKPRVRRQELIDIAAALFAEKGYEAVSVRDILEMANGVPGMFYYYFKSKQEIHMAAMEQYITRRLERKCKIMEDEEIPFENKLPVFRNTVEEDIQGYVDRFVPQDDASISDNSYKPYDLVHMLDRMVVPYSKFTLQGIWENKLKNRFHITEENVQALATFVLRGAWGMIYNNKFTGSGDSYNLENMFKITDQLLY